MIRTYSEVRKLVTFKERYEYLKLRGIVGESTFGWERYLNQMLYQSKRWKSIRNEVILRDEGCDLGHLDYEIADKIYVHHMNPITAADIENHNDDLFNPKYLICTSFNTHQAITYGRENLLPQLPKQRFPGDTCLWR